MPQAHKKEEIQSCNVLRAVRVCKLHTVGPETTAASVPRVRPVVPGPAPCRLLAARTVPALGLPGIQGVPWIAGCGAAAVLVAENCGWCPQPRYGDALHTGKALVSAGDLSGCSVPLFPVPFLWFAAFFWGAAMACGPGAALRAPETRAAEPDGRGSAAGPPPLACSLCRRKGAVLEHPGNFSWPMVVENHQELVFLSNKVPLCT